MKTYNRSLDYVTLAMAKAHSGDPVTAAKLFAKAIQAPDVTRAIAVLEASNKQAFAATAAAKAKTAKTAKPAVAAAARIKAEAEFDMGDDEAIEELTNDDSDDMVDDEEIIEEAVVEDEDDEGFDAQFAKVLASMQKKKSK